MSGARHYRWDTVLLLVWASLVAGMVLSSGARYLDGLDRYHFNHADGSVHTVTGRDLTVTYTPGQALRHPPCAVTGRGND